MNRSMLISVMLVIILIASGVLMLPSLNGVHPLLSFVHGKVWGNRIKIFADGSIAVNQITLVFKNEGAIIQVRSKADSIRIVDNAYMISIIDTFYQNGKQVQPIPYDYGPQIIEVYYKNEFVGKFGHWKTNNWHAHDYVANLQDSMGTIIFSGSIEGPDGELGKK